MGFSWKIRNHPASHTFHADDAVAAVATKRKPGALPELYVLRGAMSENSQKVQGRFLGSWPGMIYIPRGYGEKLSRFMLLRCAACLVDAFC